MTDSLLNIARMAWRIRGLVDIPFAFERFTSSVAAHIANIENRMACHEVLSTGKGYPLNLRLHVLFMAPSGWGKSLLYEAFLDPRSGLVRAAGWPTALGATFSPESWAGTSYEPKGGGQPVPVPGLFEEMKTGFIGADEFQKIEELLKGTGATNEEVYLMTALDRDRFEKRTASGGGMVVEDICTTVWFGLRPAPLSSKSGLFRRFAIQLFLPNRLDVALFNNPDSIRRLNYRKHYDAMVNPDTGEEIPIEIGERPIFPENEELQRSFGVGCENCAARVRKEPPDLSDFRSWCLKKGVPRFEQDLLLRLALGYSLATQAYPTVEVRGPLESLLLDEIWSRTQVTENPWRAGAAALLKENPDPQDGAVFARRNWQLTEGEAKLHLASGARVPPEEVRSRPASVWTPWFLAE